VEKIIAVCTKCCRSGYGTRDEMRANGWKFIPTTLCSICNTAPKRGPIYKADECFNHDWLTGESIDCV